MEKNKIIKAIGIIIAVVICTSWTHQLARTWQQRAKELAGSSGELCSFSANEWRDRRVWHQV